MCGRTASSPRVAVVLCSWRGTVHLAEQLDSLAGQSVPHRLFVHDDASGDGTAALARAHPAVERVIEHSGNVGHVANFERALADALAHDVEHVAFADQDDLWHPERLARGLAAMADLERRHGRATPALVHSDLEMIDAAGEPLAPSFLDWRGYAIDDTRSLERMLGPCGVMGNTCLINRALGELALPFPPALHVHDWWLGVLAELYGARRLLREPLVRYRIHEANASNSTQRLDGGAGRASLARALARDFRLPFREDTRVGPIESLLAGDGHRPPLDARARATLEGYRRYLRGEGSRWSRARWLLGGERLGRGRRRRLRAGCATLLSARYGRGRGPRDGGA